MIPLPRHRSWIDDTEEGLNVFVPGIMGAGVLLSLGILITDLINRIRGDRGKHRRRRLVGGYIARDVLSSIHEEESADAEHGLRHRYLYLLGGATFVGLALYGFVGSFWNYFNPVDDGWVEDIAWVWAVSLVAVVGLLSIGGLLLYVGFRHPNVPPRVRRFLARTPMGAIPRSD